MLIGLLKDVGKIEIKSNLVGSILYEGNKNHFYAPTMTMARALSVTMTMAGALSVTPVRPSAHLYVCPYVTPNDVCSLSGIVLIRIL